MVTVRHVAARVRGRYLVERPASAAGAARGVVVGFHGYGQEADVHLEALSAVPGAERWWRVAVQALHPFYRRDGSVVASWMTRLDRELAIEDNVGYVARVVEEVRGEAGSDLPLAYAGFSQGVAMAYRAAWGAGHPCRALVVLGGDVPPELGGRPAGSLPPILVGRGRDDERYAAAKLRADLQRLDELGAEVESVVFAGGHEWGEEFRVAAGSFLDRHFAREA